MAFSVRRQSGVAVVEVDDKLIVANREALKDVVLAEVDAGGRKFAMDFSGTTYIDSSGLGALVSLSKKIRFKGGELRLSGLDDDLRSLFELTKLDTLFRIDDTLEESLAAF